MIPMALAIVIGALFTFLTIFDPLFAVKRAANIWDAILFFGIL